MQICHRTTLQYEWNEMTTMKIHITLLFLAGLLIQACGTKENVGSSDLVQAYSGLEYELDLSFRIFHIQEDTSRIYVKLNTKNLLYSRAATDEFSANVEIVITAKPIDPLQESTISKKTILLTDTDDQKAPKELLAQTDIELIQGTSYVVTLEITDLNRKKSYKKEIETDKSNPYKRQNFLVAKNDIRIPIFNDRVVGNETYIIQTYSSATAKLYVDYYDRIFPLPPPPFAFYEPRPFDYAPDSVFTLELDAQGITTLATAQNGFYHIRNDSVARDGLSIFVSESEFPEVKTIQNMLDPFRYLVSGKEYRRIIDAPDMRQMLESYWIDWAGNKERARASIKAYYTRVEDANVYFSSHVEGWKSDRGVIYIIYGKPNKVYKTAFMETWIYGEENNPLSITFNFIKVINPFTSNDFRLNREDYYKPSWYRAIEAWRNGRIY